MDPVASLGEVLSKRSVLLLFSQEFNLVVGIRAVSHFNYVDSEGALGWGGVGGAVWQEENVWSIESPAGQGEGGGAEPGWEGLVCHLWGEVFPSASIHVSEAVAHGAFGDGRLDKLDRPVMSGDIGGMEVGVGAASQDMTGPILVAAAVGAVAGGGWEGLFGIWFTVPVGQFAGPKVAPSGFEDLDFLLPCVEGGGPEVG